jgi:hypothetical protein
MAWRLYRLYARHYKCSPILSARCKRAQDYLVIMKKIFIFLLLTIATYKSKAQTTDSMVYNRYLDLNLAVLENRDGDAAVLLETIIPDTAKLPAKTRTSFYSIAAKMYEDQQQPAKATVFYQRITATVPDYYVAHRALGYIYFNEAEQAEKNTNAKAAYVAAAKKALPHLEKAEACDPSPETREIITSLYKKTGDTAGLKGLDDRLKQLAKKCIDILDN